MNRRLVAAIAALPAEQRARIDWVRVSLAGPEPVATVTLIGRGRAHWLVARTCPRCGELRQAAEYGQRSRGGAAWVCLQCIGRESRPYSDRDQDQTRPVARRHYELWTADELDVVLAVGVDGRWMRSTREAALVVGRTAAAVQQARSAYRNAKDAPDSSG